MNVYCQKPLTQSVWEARLMTKAAKKYDVVTQMGNQGYSSEATRVEAPMLIILAGRDERVNRSALPWGDALRAAGKPARTIVYPDVDHAFHNDTSEMRYDREAAQQAWGEATRFLAQHLST